MIDALIVQAETKTANRLLGFIDNKERASSIKIRLNDEIAERTLAAWAAKTWQDVGQTNVVDAFHMLETEIMLRTSDEQEYLATLFQEMPFWFSRMLTLWRRGK